MNCVTKIINVIESAKCEQNNTIQAIEYQTDNIIINYFIIDLCNRTWSLAVVAVAAVATAGASADTAINSS